MVTLFRRPAPALAPFVDVLWYVDEPLVDTREHKLPTGTMQLVVNLGDDELRWYDIAGGHQPHRTSGAGLCGALARPVGIDAAEQRLCVGVAFRPGGTVPFVGHPASELTEPVIDLASLWGRDGQVLRERLLDSPSPQSRLRMLEAVLEQRAARGAGPDGATSSATVMRQAAAALGRGALVRQVADETGMTASTFTRRFRAAVGLSPKRFARVRRLQRVLGAVAGASHAAVDWAAIAAGQGYADQAHLIHEFRALTGVTPSAYRSRSPSEQNHLLTER